jgi:predicted kinase
VVLDATFIDPGLRARAERLAAEAGVAFHGVWLDAPIEVLEARVAARTNDASDATVAVLHDQIARLDLAEVRWGRVDTRGDLIEAAQAWLARR